MFEETENSEQTKKTLTTLIASMLARERSKKDSNTKDILMLLAALQILNSTDTNSSYNIGAARRLIQGMR